MITLCNPKIRDLYSKHGNKLQMISNILSDMVGTPDELIKSTMEYKIEDMRCRKKEADQIAKEYKNSINHKTNYNRMYNIHL